MATLTFAYDHSRDPMNGDDLADKIAAALSIPTQPQVGITNAAQTPANSIIVTDPNITSGNTAAIQTVINNYVLDSNRVALPAGTLGTLLSKAKTAIAANNTFLAISSPTQAQTLAQVQLLSRENTAIIKAMLLYMAGQTQDTSGT